MTPKLTSLPPFPAGANPFNHDMSNMGTPMGKDLMLMHSNHATERCRFLILVDTATGERWRLDLVENTKVKDYEDDLAIDQFNRLQDVLGEGA